MSKPLKSLEQEEAMYALECVKSLQGKGKMEGEYLSLVQRIPAMILTSGLGQTLAFLKAKDDSNHEKAKDDSHHEILFKQIAVWLSEKRGIYPNSQDLMKHLMEHDMTFYVTAHHLTLRLLNWLVRFAKGYLKSNEEA